MKSGPHLPQLERALTQKLRLNTVIKKERKKEREFLKKKKKKKAEAHPYTGKAIERS